jgi:hypothetical protein
MSYGLRFGRSGESRTGVMHELEAEVELNPPHAHVVIEFEDFEE